MKLWVWRIVKRQAPGLNIHRNGLSEEEPRIVGAMLVTTRKGRTSANPVPPDHWVEWEKIAGEKEAQEWVYDRRP